MKKRFLLLTTLLSIALSGCGGCNSETNATLDTSLPVETASPEPTVEPTTTESTERGTVKGHEVPVDEPTTQEPSKSEINDTDTQVADGVENENNVAPSVEETTVEETPADSNSDIILEYPENDTYTLTASDIEMLRFFGATESEINSIHSLQEFDNLLVRLLEAYENNSDSSSDTGSTSSDSGSGNTGGSEDAHDPSRVPQLGDHDIPGGM